VIDLAAEGLGILLNVLDLLGHVGITGIDVRDLDIDWIRGGVSWSPDMPTVSR